MAINSRISKPKNKRSKRVLEAREPKAIENTKTAVVVRGPKCSQLVQDCMKDLVTLKKPNAVAYNKKNNNIRPFEDANSLEFFGQKLDASLFVFGNHNKKRPNNLIFGRLYDHHLLDMMELGLDSFTAIKDFKNSKIAVGTKPCLLFEGESFADKANTEMQRLKSLFIDFFRGPEVTNVRLAGIEHVLQFTSLEKKVFIRSYKINLKKSGGRVPRVTLEEIGPRLDLTLRRTHLASDDLFKTACKQVKNVHQQKKIKNVSEDALGTKLGRVHVQSQEIGKIQTRKVKALKESQSEKLEKLEHKKEKAEAARRRAVEAVFADGED